MIADILKVGCVTLITLALLGYLFQRNLIYFPTQKRPNQHAYQATDLQELSLTTPDGIHLLAWYKVAKTNQPTVLLLHGNAGHIGYRMPLARAFLKAGLGVFLLEYRGYGGNKGTPTEQGLYLDARTAIHFLQQQGISFQHLALYGESLGTGVAIKMAEEFPVCALVLQSPYTSLPALAQYHYPWIVIAPWDKYNSLARIMNVQSPLLILHGKEDSLIPFEHALALFNKANEPKTLLGLNHKGHHDLWDPSFMKTGVDFIQSHCSF